MLSYDIKNSVSHRRVATETNEAETVKCKLLAHLYLNPETKFGSGGYYFSMFKLSQMYIISLVLKLRLIKAITC